MRRWWPHLSPRVAGHRWSAIARSVSEALSVTAAQVERAIFSARASEALIVTAAQVERAVFREARAENLSVSDSQLGTVNQAYVSYSTTFPDAQNPITTNSDGGGSWHGTTVQSKTAVQTAGGNAYGTMPGFDGTNYNDSCACLSAAFSADQRVTATLANNGAGGLGVEAELLLRCTFDATHATCYELDLVNSGGHAVLVRWDFTSTSAPNAFSWPPLADTSTGPNPGAVSFADGAVWSFEITGTVITAKCKAPSASDFTTVITYDTAGDSIKYATGSPGIGFWDNDGANNLKLGWKDFTAVSLAAGATAFPTWRQGLTLNQWSLLAGSSMSRVNPTPQRPGNTGPSSKIITWTSMTVDPSDSSIYSVANGGHHDYSGNEADRIRMSDNAPQWDERRPSIAGGSVVEAVDYYSLSPVEPTSTHSYYGMFFVASRREVITIGGARWDQNGGATRRVAAFNIDTNTWAADDTWQDLPAVLYTSDQNAGFCQDLSTGDIYGFGGWSVYKLSATTRTWTQMLTDIPSFNCHNCPSAYDTTRRRFLIAGGSYTMHHVYDIDANTATAITFTGAQASTVQNGSSGALVYVPALDKYIYKGNVSGGALVQIDPVTFDCTTYVTTGGSTIPQAFVTGSPPTGLYNKLLDLPRMACLALVTANDTTWSGDNVWVIPYSNNVSDFQTRAAGARVVWYHDFNTQAQVDQFRWTNRDAVPPEYQSNWGGNNPLSRGDGDRIQWMSTGGPSGGGYVRGTYGPGTTGNGSSWWRPFNPLDATSTGKGIADPADGGSIPRMTLHATDGGSQVYDWANGSRPGYYGHTDYASGSAFDGSEFYIQVRVRRSNTGGPNLPGYTGKFVWITCTFGSYTEQELLTYGQCALDEFGVYSAHNMYQGHNYAPLADVCVPPGPGTQIQIGRDNPAVCDWYSRNTGGCWRYSGGWDTLLYHIVPGHNSVADTHLQVYAQHDPKLYPAERGRYTKIWDVIYPAYFEQAAPGRNGWNALILGLYHNGVSFANAFTQEYGDLIFSKAFIPPPTL